MAASQQYEQSSQQYETYCTEEKLDELFLEASQLLDVEPCGNSMVVKPSGKRRFCQPQSEKDIQAVKESRVLKKTLQNTEWAQSIWRGWATHRLEQLLSAENCGFCVSFCKATLHS